MTKAEMRKVFSLLQQYYPRAKQLYRSDTLAAWRLALELFTYEDVKNAVVLYAVKNKYFPDVADITGKLTPRKQLSELEQRAIEALKEKQP